MKKQRDIRKKSNENQYISDIFGKKKFFSKIQLSHILGIANKRLCAKNRKKLMMKSRENAKKPVFRHISGIFGRKNFFFKNRAPSLFGNHHFASLCKKSEKTNESIPRKAGNRRTDGRTDGRTNGRTSVNLKDLRGRSKKEQSSSNLNTLILTQKRELWDLVGKILLFRSPFHSLNNKQFLASNEYLKIQKG